MRKLYVLSLMVCLFFLQTSKICAQNIGIGTTTPSANAILHLENGVSNLGLLLPNLDHTTFTPLASDAGLLVFDNVLNEVFYWDGTSWFPAGGTVSLQAAYDGGQLVNMGSGNIDFQSSAANPLLYLDEGNERIGIGTNSPSQDLDVNGIVNAQNGLYLDGNRAIVNDGFGRTEFFTPNGLTELLELNGFDITFQVVPVRINQRLAIGNIPSVSINPNAALELVENNQGLRFNRVDTSSFTGILNSTDIGLTVYDSLENELFIWNGTNWETTINSGASGWELTGNAGTLDGTDFIGTSDNIPLSFRVNNQAAGRIESGLGANTFYGFNAGQSANNNINATAFGSAALISLTSGDANSAFGRGAMNLMSTGTGNVALGFNSLFSSTNGVDNVAVGFNAMSTSSGDRNTSIGTFSMQSMSGFNNVALGYGALRAAGTESNNVAVGFQALSLSTGGGGNTALGVNAGAANITGTGNTFIGQNADAASGALVNATAIGNGAIVSANNSLVLGNSANVGIGISNPAHTLDISGGNVNIDLTHAYLQNGAHLISVSPANYNLRIGTNAGQAITTGDENITMGLNAGLSIADGGSNIAIGYEALRNTTSGNGNIAIGRLGGISNISGSGNIGVGGESNHNVLSGSNNVAVGTDAQYQNSTGNLNTAIGAGSGVISNNLNNTTAIGGFARVDSDNSLVLGSINGVGAGTADVSVGIGTPTPNQNASLDLGHDDRGLQLNRVDASTILGLGALDEGLIYYDSPANQILYWNGSDFDTLGNSSAGGEPVGTIMAFAGGAIPPGYLACDGALISRTTYADLFTAIGTAWGTTNASNFRVPDLRGKFMRGVSGGSGFDPDAASRIAQYTGGNGGNAVGSYQLDAFQGHWHQSYRDPGAGGLGSLGSAFSDGLGIGTSSIDHTREPKSDGTNGAPRTGAETRPVNLYVNYIIKYQPGATAGGGGGTVTSITAGIGLTGGTITSTGTIGLDNSGVTAGTYGSATESPQITVDATGRITSVTNQNIIAGVGGSGSANKLAYWTGANTLSFNSGLHYESASQRLGIGTAAPAEFLHVNSGNPITVASRFTNATTGFTGSDGFGFGITGTGNAFINNDEATPINISTASTTRMTIGATGNIGIGNNAPNAPLQFATALANRKIVLFEGANNDHQYFGFGVNGAALRYQVNGTFASHIFYASVNTTTSNELMRIVGDGRVGIGTSTPTAGYLLDVTGADAIINGITVGRGGGTNTNTALGANALSNNTGSGNVGIGLNALQNNLGGVINIAIGSNSLGANTTGSFNIAIGENSQNGSASSSDNVSLGVSALENNQGNLNTAIGNNTLRNNTTGNSNHAIGYNALNGNTTGGGNIAMGNEALFNTNADANVGLGNRALIGNTSGEWNVSVGARSSENNTTGINNTTVGAFAMDQNVSGSNNTAIGYGATTIGGNLNNATAIGAGANVAVNNALILGNNANVGIGLNAPSERLHITSGAGSTGMIITNDFLGTTATDGLLIGISGSNAVTINNRENGPLLLGTNGLPNINQLVLDPSGNVGLNITPPTERLHINGNLRLAGAFMPNNLPGAVGDVLISGGAGAPPTWGPGTGFSTAGNGLSSSASTINLGGTVTSSPTIFESTNSLLFLMQSSNAALGSSAGIKLRMFDTSVADQWELLSVKSDATANSGQSDFLIQKLNSTAGGNIQMFTIDGNNSNVIINNAKTSASPYGDFLVLNGEVGIGTNAPGTNKLSVVTQSTNGSAGYFENNIGSGIDGSALRVLNSGVRSIGHNAALIQNLVTKVGGSNSTKIGLKIESTGAWGVATVNQPNIGLDVTVSGADDNYAAIFNGGNVGIGTNAPTYKLTVEGDHIGLSNGWGIVTKNFAGTYEGFLWGRFGGTDATLMNVGTGGLFIRDNVGSSNFMVIDGVNGNVGIGTSSPAYTLDINGGAGVRIEPQTGGDNWLSFVNSNDGNLAWGINDGWTVNRDFRLYRYNNIGTFLDQPLTVQNSTGNVGINIINPTFKLHVNGSVAGVGAYNNLSDKRFKKSVKPISDPLQKVLALEGISFEWDNTLNPTLEIDDKRHLGFLAQDVEKILPLVVNTSIDTLNTKTVEYSSMVPVLVEAIKEQQAIIEYQKSLIETLQVQNTESLKSDENVQNKLNLLQTQIDQLNAILSMEAKK